MKRFALTLLVTLGIAFTAFPFLFVVLTTQGGGAGDFVASVIMMFFVQFISPFHFWIVPLAMGFLAASLWRLFNLRAPGRVS